MKLIYANGACSLSVHIMLEELSASFEAIRVSLQDKKVLESYNPKSYVPALVLDDGTVMTEAVSILIYLSENSGGKFMPKEKLSRAKCIEWLSFISSELHKGVGPLFHRKEISEEYKNAVMERLHHRLSFVNEALESRDFLQEEYSIADMYALAILRIITGLGVSLSDHTHIESYIDRLMSRPVIARVIEFEAGAPLATEFFEKPPVRLSTSVNEPRAGSH